MPAPTCWVLAGQVHGPPKRKNSWCNRGENQREAQRGKPVNTELAKPSKGDTNSGEHTIDKALKTRTETFRRNEGDRISLQAHVSCYCKTSAAQWNLSNTNSPQARKQTWRHRVWVWKKDVWGVRGKGWPLCLWDREPRRTVAQLVLRVPLRCPQRCWLKLTRTQNLLANSNGKL